MIRSLRLLLLCALLLPATCISLHAQDPLTAHAGEALMRAIREHYRPARLAEPDEALSIDSYRDTDGTARVHSYLRASARSRADVEADLQPFHIARPSWWSYSQDFGDTLRVDLHNIVTVEATDADALGAEVPGFAPGQADPSAAGDFGTLRIPVPGDESTRTACYTPPLRWRGDFARAIFYMVTLYPTQMWHIDCRLILNRRSYPFFSDYGVETLLSWHRADPPDAVERARMEAVAALQDNVNPFVERPELVEYLWGELKGQSVLPPAVDPDNPDAPDEPTNLRPVYYRSADRTIHFLSPYVPPTAVWSIDSSEVSDGKIGVEQLSDGRHEITFKCPDGTRGKLIIEILP